MPRPLIASLFCLFLVMSAAAEDRWVLVAGSVGVFRTDARVFNPSFDRDIQVTARFLATDANNAAAMASPGASFTVPKRSMRVLNDVTTTLFGATPTVVGAIHFSSPDAFEVTSRIYAPTPAGTAGQFGPGLPTAAAKSKGAILQMRDNGGPGQSGTFRTNVGAVNTVGTETVIRWTLYDRSNSVAATGATTLPPFGVTPPTRMTADRWFQPAPSGADLSDAWISFSADHPVFVYASVVDNGTPEAPSGDQTFIPAVDDAGVPPPQQTTRTFNVVLEDFSITFSPAPTGIRVGDQVRLIIETLNGAHGFQLTGPNFNSLVGPVSPSSPVERTFIAGDAGVYQYFCTQPGCGIGHGSMFGTFQVTAANAQAGLPPR